MQSFGSKQFGAVFRAGKVSGGNAQDLRADDAVGRIGFEGVGACGGLALVGPAVAIRICLRIEGWREELVVVEFLFPEVAQAVGVGVEDGLAVWRDQNPEARNKKEEEGARRSFDGLARDAPATLKRAFHWAPPFAVAAGVSVRQ